TLNFGFTVSATDGTRESDYENNRATFSYTPDGLSPDVVEKPANPSVPSFADYFVYWPWLVGCLGGLVLLGFVPRVFNHPPKVKTTPRPDVRRPINNDYPPRPSATPDPRGSGDNSPTKAEREMYQKKARRHINQGQA